MRERKREKGTSESEEGVCAVGHETEEHAEFRRLRFRVRRFGGFGIGGWFNILHDISATHTLNLRF